MNDKLLSITTENSKTKLLSKSAIKIKKPNHTWINFMQRLTGPQELEQSPFTLTETSWDTLVTALKIKRANSPKPLDSGPCQSVHWDLFASALIHVKHLRCKATEKHQVIMKLGLRENVVVFNTALISDTKDDLPMEDMLIKLHLSKPLNIYIYTYKKIATASFFDLIPLIVEHSSALSETQSPIVYLSHLL